MYCAQAISLDIFFFSLGMSGNRNSESRNQGGAGDDNGGQIFPVIF